MPMIRVVPGGRAKEKKSPQADTAERSSPVSGQKFVGKLVANGTCYKSIES